MVDLMEDDHDMCMCFSGDPFHFQYWLAQCAVYLVVTFIEKLCVGPLIFFKFWTKVSQV